MHIDEDMSLSELLTEAELGVVNKIETEVQNALNNYLMRTFLKGVLSRFLEHFEAKSIMPDEHHVAAVSQNVRSLMKHSLDEENSEDPCLLVAQRIHRRLNSKMVQKLTAAYMQKFEGMLASDDINEARVIKAAVDRVWPMVLKKLS